MFAAKAMRPEGHSIQLPDTLLSIHAWQAGDGAEATKPLDKPAVKVN
jgi:hypothetical protein